MRFAGMAFITGIVFLCLQLFGATDWSWGYICLPWAWLVGAICHEAQRTGD